MIDIKNTNPGALYKTSDNKTILWDNQDNVLVLKKDTIVMYLKTEFDKDNIKIVRTFFLLGGRLMHSELHISDLGCCLWDHVRLLKTKE